MAEILNLKSQHFHLLPEKAVWWEESKTFLISDIHLGKISHFRREGIAVPDAMIADNFKRLDHLISKLSTKKIIFLGDLFHHRMNIEWNIFTEWRMKNKNIEMNIVLGNHDIIPKKEFHSHGIQPYSELITGNFRFSHFPSEEIPENLFSFCGHVHPVFRLTSARQSVKLPCFAFTKQQLILPSFGSFTGGYTMAPESAEVFYLIAENSVIPFRP